MTDMIAGALYVEDTIIINTMSSLSFDTFWYYKEFD